MKIKLQTFSRIVVNTLKPKLILYGYCQLQIEKLDYMSNFWGAVHSNENKCISLFITIYKFIIVFYKVFALHIDE